MKIIIPCGAKKRPIRSRARDLYQGSYFKMNLRWALSVAVEQNILILSAKHGLVSLLQMLEPYDQFMGDAGSISAKVISDQARALGLIGERIYALGGVNYLSMLKRAGLVFCAPVAGVGGMGSQMSILKKNMGRLPVWKEFEG